MCTRVKCMSGVDQQEEKGRGVAGDKDVRRAHVVFAPLPKSS